MLYPEDQLVIGLSSEAHPERRPSAVSQALRAVAADVDTWDETEHAGEKAQFRIRVAADKATRERAYGLAYRVYRERGYVPANESGRVIAPYDARPETLTVLVEDLLGNA